MGRRCGCVDDRCSCAIVAGRGISLSGSGDRNNPLVVSTTYEAHAYMQGRSSSNTDVNLTGTGTAEDPLLLKVDFNVPEPRPLPVSTYTSPGTFMWTRPSNVTMVDVWVVGGGASGTPGYEAAGVRYGGQGGAGGGWSYSRIRLPAEVTKAQVRVGRGGFSVPYYYGAYSNSGGNSWFTPMTDDSVTPYTTPYLTVFAGGGGALGAGIGGVGTSPGQAPQAWNVETPWVNGPGAGAGGGGGGGTGDEVNGRPGGDHVWFSTGQRMGGYGGDGGDARWLLGAGIIYEGQPGSRGGGGGGGGAPSNDNPGGASGSGGDGVVWIVSI